MKKSLVIFGTSNILSDIFDCAIANQLSISKIVTHLPEEIGERNRSLSSRIQDLSVIGEVPTVQELNEFSPSDNELYILGPTTPTRSNLAAEIKRRFNIHFTQLIHPTAYVSPLAKLSEGVFIGANSVIGPGAHLAEHVFINRGVTIGHDTYIGSFSRIQPGCNLGGLSRIGNSVTVGIGATLIERLIVGDDAFIGAGAVVTSDVTSKVLVVGIPAKFKKNLS